MISIERLEDWLSYFTPETVVGISSDGTCLCVRHEPSDVEPDLYIEIGCISDEAVSEG